MKAQKRTYEARQRCTLGLLPESVSMRGLDVLAAVRDAARDAGVPVSQLMLALEAFVVDDKRTTRMSVRCLAAQKQWEILAATLLGDVGYLASPSTPQRLFGDWGEDAELVERLRVARNKAVRTNFSVLEYEERACERPFCFFSRCRGQRRMCYKLSTAQESLLDVDIAATLTQQKREREREQQEQRPKSRTRRKSVQFNLSEDERPQSLDRDSREAEEGAT
jgi:hypothetical protein